MAHFEIAEGWHLYWDNPGESGLRTTAELEGPAGVEIGQVRYPGPEAFESPGDIRSYGYEGSTALFATAKLPSKLPAQVSFEVEGTWLACSDRCIRGSAKASLSLPRAKRARPAPQRVQRRIARHRARLPRPWPECPGATAARDGSAVLLHVDAPPPKVEFFPARHQPAMIDDIQVKPAGKGTQVRVELRGKANSAIEAVAGVVRVGDTYYDVSIPYR